MTFGRALRSAYAGGWGFVRACPLLFLVPVAVELLQHLIEVRIGMYGGIAQAKAVEHDPWRMGFGFVKVAALMLPAYWTVRWLAWRDAARAARFERPAAALFAGFAAFKLAIDALVLFVLPQTGAVLIAAFVGGHVLACLVAAWSVAAALGNPAIGPRASVAIMGRRLGWTFAFLLVAILPPLILHYALAAAAILGPKALLWPVLVVDSLLVGGLAVVMAASGYVAVARAAARAGVTLEGGAAPLAASQRATVL